MARKVEPGHVLVTDEEALSKALEESELAQEAASETLVLTGAGSYCFRGQKYLKGQAVPVGGDVAEHLKRTGMFERG